MDTKTPGVAAGHPKPETTEGTRGGAAAKGSGQSPEIARATGQEAAKDKGGRMSVPADFAQKLGAGEPLDAQTRAFFEQRLEADLSGVRIHTDAAADKAAKEINARAFTFGRHIAFAAGAYQPGSDQGRRLLAHELAHVRQQESHVARQIMRQPAGTAPAGGSSNEIELKGVKIPAFKISYYNQAPYKRAANYKRSEKGSKQKKLWDEGTETARKGFPGAYGLKDGAIYVALPKKTKLDASNGDMVVGEPKVIAELISRPKWKKDGTPNTHDIDHKVELQIGGPDMDKLDNLELRDSKANQDSGRNIDASITEKLRNVKDKEDGDPEKIRANPNYTFVFSDFANGGGATDSSKWEQGPINKLEAAEGLVIYDPDATADTGKVKAWPKDADKTDFFGGPDLLVLYPSRRGGKPQKIKLKGGKPDGEGQLPKTWIPGFTIDSFDLTQGAGDEIGSISFTFAVDGFPKGYDKLPRIKIRKLSEGLKQAGFVSVEGVRNRVVQLLKAKTPVPQTSPVTIDENDVDILPGTGLVISGQINPSISLLGGPIDFSVQGKSFELSKTFTNDEIKIPGPFKVKSSSLTVALNSGSGFSVTGFVGYEIPKLGEGSLVGKGQMSGFLISGNFIFDKKLFDGKAELAATYKKEGEAGKFSGTAKLEISNKKIKGIKKATIDATIDDEKFTLDGNAETEIPGIKRFSVGIKFVDADNFSITGSGDLEKLPGITGGSLTMTVDRTGDGWELSGKGSVTPKLPGGASGTIDGSYKKGVVLIRGKVHFSYGSGLLDGDVTVAVTNAASVDKEGNASGEGGKSFKAFGEGDIKATLIKDKLDGNLKLRLLPDGSIRVGGGLKVRDFEAFGRYPQDGGKFFDHTFSTPPVPIPGLGFTVGSVSVGITFSASVSVSAHACVGPGKLTGITATVKEFDPANVDVSTLEISGGGNFELYADAGFGAEAKVNLIFGAAIAELVGSIGVSASAGIPADRPVLSAHVGFVYSQAKGVDLNGKLDLNIQPELKFKLIGEVSARLNVVVDTITVWKKDWNLAEANYKLPIGIHATGDIGYNSKTGKITPAKPSDAITVEKPKLDAESMKGVLMGDKAPAQVKNEDKQGNEVDQSTLMCLPQDEQNQSVMPPAPNQSVMPPSPNQSVKPRHEDEATGGPESVDEGVVARLGTGLPLDLASRGYFEQRMQVDLNRVRFHTGPGAAREAENLGARAFTVGEHIAFAAGEYQPDTPEGQDLIAHELAHIAQAQSGGAPIVLRWPAVTRTDAHTGETPASVRAMKLAEFISLTHGQLDWATSPALQADAGALTQFRQIQGFADGPRVVDACGDLKMDDIIAKGVPGIFPILGKYRDGVTGGTTAWLRRTNKIDDAQRWGTGLTGLEAAWPAANLSLVMRAPDPVTNPSPFEKLTPAAAPELPNFINFLTTCAPVLSADNGAEVDSFLDLRREGVMPSAYLGTVRHVKNYHHFTKNTLDGLAANEAFPQWRQAWAWTRRPLTVTLYPAVDHNGAFHRNAGLEAMVLDNNILTIVVEGLATVGDYRSQLAPVAARYGVDGKIQQAMVAGHGNATVLELAGTAGASITGDALGTTGAGGANTTSLMTELTRLMSADPTKRRIVLDACLTNSHHVASALRAPPADAAADVQAAITANPSLRDVVAGIAGGGSQVFGSNSSFAPSQTTFLSPGSGQIGLSVPGDPDLTANKLTYVEFGTEPEGCMRAVLECWADDQRAGTHACRDAMQRRIAAGRSTHVAVADTWREHIIQPLYHLAVNHYLGSGEAIRQMCTLAGSLFELYWPGHTDAAALEAALGALGGNVAHIDRMLAGPAADPHYAATPRVALVIEQVWMRHNPAHRAGFLAALGRYGDCLQAAKDLDMAGVMAQVPALLTLPPAVPPPAAQFMLALLATHHAPLAPPLPAVLPAYIDFLRTLLGAGPTFPAGLNIVTVLGGLCNEEDILAAIGRPLSGPAAAVGGKAPPPGANIDTARDAANKNDFFVTPLRRTGQVNTVKDDLLVRSTPTTASGANVFARLPTGTTVLVVGQYSADWYAIEQPGRTGFVAARYITLLP
jgi:hypothetical protein